MFYVYNCTTDTVCASGKLYDTLQAANKFLDILEKRNPDFQYEVMKEESYEDMFSAYVYLG